MHKSRLGTIVIDCESTDVEQVTEFWSKALGWAARPLKDPNDSGYRLLNAPADGPTVLVQAVQHPSRVHIDIETDDIESEVARLEQLGATRVKFVKRWWVMQAPTGQRFCVVNPQRADFETAANVWQSDQPAV
jgi:predicted enzyme related to lactoylglutathione lyase